MDAYDIKEIMAEMELALVESYKRNMSKHSQDELTEGFSWEMWQAKKLRDLKVYQKESRKIVDRASKVVKDESGKIVTKSFEQGASLAEADITGLTRKVDDEGFGKLNRRRLDALLSSTTNDLDTAFASTLRLTKDKYREIVFKAQLMHQAGAATLSQAIDVAARDFLKDGINCIVYKNGAKVNVASYAEMAIRTASKRAYFTGEGAMAAELGETLVKVSSYGACSPTCLPWQGKVYVDDVYNVGKPTPGYGLLSTAMSQGLYHPNCRHTHSVYFDTISEKPSPVTQPKEGLYKAEQRQREIERNIRKYKRVEAGSVDPVNSAKAQQKVKHWQSEMRSHLKDNPDLRRQSWRESIKGIVDVDTPAPKVALPELKPISDSFNSVVGLTPTQLKQVDTAFDMASDSHKVVFNKSLSGYSLIKDNSQQFGFNPDMRTVFVQDKWLKDKGWFEAGIRHESTHAVDWIDYGNSAVGDARFRSASDEYAFNPVFKRVRQGLWDKTTQATVIKSIKQIKNVDDRLLLEDMFDAAIGGHFEGLRGHGVEYYSKAPYKGMPQAETFANLGSLLLGERTEAIAVVDKYMPGLSKAWSDTIDQIGK